jgi:hypothetical protein
MNGVLRVVLRLERQPSGALLLSILEFFRLEF